MWQAVCSDMGSCYKMIANGSSATLVKIGKYACNNGNYNLGQDDRQCYAHPVTTILSQPNPKANPVQHKAFTMNWIPFHIQFSSLVLSIGLLTHSWMETPGVWLTVSIVGAHALVLKHQAISIYMTDLMNTSCIIEYFLNTPKIWNLPFVGKLNPTI